MLFILSLTFSLNLICLHATAGYAASGVLFYLQGRGSGICVSYLKIVGGTNVFIYLSVAVSVYRSAIVQLLDFIY